MKVSKRTERLIREAAVAGFACGHLLGPRDRDDEPYPKDRAVVGIVLGAARSCSDLYPTLAKVEPQTVFLQAEGVEHG